MKSPTGKAHEAIKSAFDEHGFYLVRNLLEPSLCDRFVAGYDEDQFRSVVTMARHGFGRGEYKYYAYPLPAQISALRSSLYSQLVPIANDWQVRLGSPVRYPPTHSEFLDRCHALGQRRPTPLILRYRPGDYNCLHQDVYGEAIFPLQAAILLSDTNSFGGGEFVLTEQRQRRQSQAHVIALEQGDAVVFPVRDRPIAGARGFYRAQYRHGVSEIRSGLRHTLGVIFHDAT